MGVFALIIAAVWIGFSSVITGIWFISDDVTQKTEIIRICEAVGQFQYDTTIVECKIKEGL